MSLTRREFINSIAGLFALGAFRPQMVFAAGGAGGSVDIVIRLFLYGGMDGLLAFAYREGPLATALRLSNIRGAIHPTNTQQGNSTNFSVSVANLD